MADKKELVVEFSATDRISEVVGKINKGLEGMETELTTLRNYSAIAFAGLTAAIGFASHAAIEAQDSINKAGSAVRIAGQNWELYRRQVEETTAALQLNTRFSDDDFQRAFAQVVNITGDASRSLENLSLIADVATARNLDLSTAADAVGKAMQGNIGRLGVLFPELQRNIEALGDTASNSEKAGVAIDYLSKKFKGLAEQDAKSLGGQLVILKNQFGELQEAIGNAFINELGNGTENVKSHVVSLTNWVKENEKLISVLGSIATILSLVLAAITSIGLIIPKLTEGLGGLVKLFTMFGGAVPLILIGGIIAGAFTKLGYEIYQAHKRTNDLKEATEHLGESLDKLRSKLPIDTVKKYRESMQHLNTGLGPPIPDEYYSKPVKNATDAIKELSEQDKIWISQLKEAHEAMLKLRFDETPNISDIVDNAEVINPMQGIRDSLNKQLDITPALERLTEQATRMREILSSVGIGFANSFASNLSRVFGQIRSLASLSALKIKDIFQALTDSILDMLAQIAARMAVFGLLSLIPGFGSAVGGLGGFVFGTGRGDSIGGGGQAVPIPIAPPTNSFGGGNVINVNIGRFIGTQENALELGREIKRLQRYGQI